MSRQAPKNSQKRPARKEAREARRKGNVQELEYGISPDLDERKLSKRLECRTQAQYHYFQLMQEKQLVFGIGPAGTGKTYIAASVAANLLLDKKISKIIIARPMVANEDLGFLPGTEEEKIAPYFEPIKEALLDWIGASHLELLMKRKKIVFAPLAFLRGSTFNDAFVILDEAQNTTPKQMKMFLTRIGKNCTMVIDGDIDQVDIKGMSGLTDALGKLEKLSNVGILEFDDSDIVRSGIVKDILMQYRKNIKS